MRAPRQQVKHILRTNDREQPRLRVAVDGREEHGTTWLRQVAAGSNDGRRIGYVFEHLHASHDIKRCGPAFR